MKIQAMPFKIPPRALLAILSIIFLLIVIFSHVFGNNTDPCAAVSPTPGITCADGSYYIGEHPVTHAKLYAMQVDAPTALGWNNGRSHNEWYDKNDLPTNCPAWSAATDQANPSQYSEAMASCYDGMSNTNTLDLLGNNGINELNDAPYKAAAYCANLNLNAKGNTKLADGPTHADWYLPSINELNMMHKIFGPHPPTDSFQNMFRYRMVKKLESWSLPDKRIEDDSALAQMEPRYVPYKHKFLRVLKVLMLRILTPPTMPPTHGFQRARYWSSSEESPGGAWYENFESVYGINQNGEVIKLTPYLVRCIRQ